MKGTATKEELGGLWCNMRSSWFSYPLAPSSAHIPGRWSLVRSCWNTDSQSLASKLANGLIKSNYSCLMNEEIGLNLYPSWQLMWLRTSGIADAVFSLLPACHCGRMEKWAIAPDLFVSTAASKMVISLISCFNNRSTLRGGGVVWSVVMGRGVWSCKN